jgi:hypothetical protein
MATHMGIKLKGNVYWAPTSIVIDDSGTTLANVFDNNSKIKTSFLPIDQTYGATSSNPQSGKAVAQAIAAAIINPSND